MKTAIDVQSQCLAEVLGQFEMLGISVQGSEPSNSPDIVRLLVKGAWLPESPLITIEVSRVAVKSTMQITARAEAVTE